MLAAFILIPCRSGLLPVIPFMIHAAVTSGDAAAQPGPAPVKFEADLEGALRASA